MLAGLAAAAGPDHAAASSATARVPQAATARHAGRHTRMVFHDGFESENFSAWSQLLVGGDAKALVQSAFVKSGSVAAELSESRHRGSRASVAKALRGAYGNLLVSGAFQMRNQRARSVPLMRLLDARRRPLVTVSRSRQWLGVAYGRGATSTRQRLALRHWAGISLALVLGRRSSTIEVWVGRRVAFRASHARISSRGVSILQIGNRAPGQPFTLVADAIIIQSRAAARRSVPINTDPPSISGTFQARQRVTASIGTWAGTRASRYAYRWRRCNRGGSGCQTIPGARAQSYALTAADVGHRIRVAVIAVNSVGAATSSSAASAVVGPASAPPVATGPPVISGTPQSGQTLGAQPGAWSGSAPLNFKYQWLQCDASGASCGPVGGAAGPVYAVRAADIGNTLRVTVTAANAVGSASSVSAPTAVIQAGPSESALVALWHMDETTGSTMHDVIGHHNGTAYHVQTGLPGLAGHAFGFNGSSSYASVPSAASLDPGSAPVTITIHLQTTGTPPAPPADWDVIRKGLYTSSGAEYKMEFQQSGQASCGFEGSAGYSELIAGPKINDGQWHTVQCMKSSSAIGVVVDGASYTQTAAIGSISNSAPVVIGARPGSDWYRGTLDEASIQVG